MYEDKNGDKPSGSKAPERSNEKVTFSQLAKSKDQNIASSNQETYPTNYEQEHYDSYHAQSPENQRQNHVPINIEKVERLEFKENVILVASNQNDNEDRKGFLSNSFSGDGKNDRNGRAVTTEENDDVNGSDLDDDTKESSGENTSGMVRSGTFDLECQKPLESALDADGKFITETETKKEQSKPAVTSELPENNMSSGSFYLHEPPATQPIFPVIPQFELNDLSSQRNSINSDSGFLSQNGIPICENNIADSTESSRLMSASLPSHNEPIKLEKGPHLSSWFIDVNKLADASRPSSENMHRRSFQYDSFPSDMDRRSSLSLPRQKMSQNQESQSLSCLIDAPELFRDSVKNIRSHENLQNNGGIHQGKNSGFQEGHPNSCYMYVDLENIPVTHEKIEKTRSLESKSISMFIDLNGDDAEYSQTQQFMSLGNVPNNPPKLAGKPRLKASNSVDQVFYSESPASHLVKQTAIPEPNNQYSLWDTAAQQHHFTNHNIPRLAQSLPENILMEQSMERSFRSDDKLENSTMSLPCSFRQQRVDSPKLLHDKKMGNELYAIDEAGLLPMSPILRRKNPTTEKPREKIDLSIKASTRPQDIDALRFRKDSTSDNEVVQIGKVSTNTVDTSFTNDVPKSDEPARKITKDNEVMNYSADYTMFKNLIYEEQSEKCDINPPLSEDSRSDSVEHTSLESRPTQSPTSQMLSFELGYDSDTVYSEVSDLNSLMMDEQLEKKMSLESSSQSPSVEDSYKNLKPCSKLGEDLLKMFGEEVKTDIVVLVEGKEIKCHRYILASRCSYFSALLKGDCLVGEESKINMQGFSFSAVYFALCHIYSGAINIPPDVNITELTLLADMLSMDTLKEVIMFHLKMNYCHFFHKPCNLCAVGVVECLLFTASCEFPDLQLKTVQWIGRYFVRIWPTKSFASLPEELLKKCYECVHGNLEVDSVTEILLNCDKLMRTLPHVKWAEPVFGLVSRLLESGVHFMAHNFDKVVTSCAFMSLGKGHSWNVTAVEDSVLTAVDNVAPDVACKTYVQLSLLLPQNHNDTRDWTQNFADLLFRIQRHVERYLIQNANRVVHCQSWALLTPAMQRKIRDAAIIVFEFEKPTAPPPMLSSGQRKFKRASASKDSSLDRNAASARKEKIVRSPRPTRITKPVSRNARPPEKTRTPQHDHMPPPKINPRTTSNSPQAPISRNSKLPKPPPQNMQSSHPQPKVVSPQKNGSLKKSESMPTLESPEEFGSCDSFPSVERYCSVSVDEDEDSHESSGACHPTKLPPRQVEKMTLPSSTGSSTHNSPGRLMLYQTSPKPVGNLASPAQLSPMSKNSQIAKVSPFTIKNDHVGSSGNLATGNKSKDTRSYSNSQETRPWQSEVSLHSPTSSHDLVAAIDAESSLVNHYLLEAEILEQELSRKLQMQQQYQTPPSSASKIQKPSGRYVVSPALSESGLHRYHGHHVQQSNLQGRRPSRSQSLRNCSSQIPNAPSSANTRRETSRKPLGMAPKKRSDNTGIPQLHSSAGHRASSIPSHRVGGTSQRRLSNEK